MKFEIRRGERQMDTPSGTTSARVADLVTRPFRISTSSRWTVILIALAATFGVGALATAQEEAVPEPAVMARLASRTLTLDAFAVDGA
jgi:hypothetical protein